MHKRTGFGAEEEEEEETRDLCLFATEHRAFPQSVQVMMSP